MTIEQKQDFKNYLDNLTPEQKKQELKNDLQNLTLEEVKEKWGFGTSTIARAKKKLGIAKKKRQKTNIRFFGLLKARESNTKSHFKFVI